MTGASGEQDIDDQIRAMLEAFASGEVALSEVGTKLRTWVSRGSVTPAVVETILRDATRRGNLTLDGYRRLSSMTPPNDVPKHSLVAETRMRDDASPETERSLQSSDEPTKAGGLRAGERELPASEGTILKGQYRLEKQIGSGGMGIVYMARDLEHERVAEEEQLVAIKVLRPEYRLQNDLVKALFEEVRKTKVLAHQNIVSIFNCQQDGPDVFVTMQYLEGMTLDRLIEEDFARGVPWERAKLIIEGIGDALAYAHDRGVIHCDLKPSNVFVTVSGNTKVLDFGIARATRGVRGQRFDAGTLRGLTVGYACPEAIQAWRADDRDAVNWNTYKPDERDDIYSFGCLIYELLTGHRPFELEDAAEAKAKGRTCPRIPSLSGSQNLALARTLSFDRENRSARVEEVLRDLLVLAPAPSPSRINWRWGIATVVALLILATAAFVVLQRRTTTTPDRDAPAGRTIPSTTPKNIDARTLLNTLGIAPTKLNADGTMSSDELLGLLKRSPRHVQLGSTPAEIQDALTLCRQFDRGCAASWYEDEMSRTPTLGPFVLDSMPVTVGEFRNFVTATHYRTGAEIKGFVYEAVNGTLRPVPHGNWQNAGSDRPAPDKWPVVAVNFSDAEAYCRWQGKRLPTEDEWEYVARGPQRSVFAWGNEPQSGPKNDSSLAAVGGGPNEGIAGHYQDLAGLVWQWVDTTDGARKILKGGAWNDHNLANRRAAVRRSEETDRADIGSGFRCALTEAQWPDADFWLPPN